MKPTHIRAALAAVALAFGAAQAAEITIYKQPNFSGDQLTLRDTRSDLSGSGFYDTVSSIVVRSGRWEFCSQPEFKGDCEVLGPGQYATLNQRLNHRIESVREVVTYARDDRGGRYARDDRGDGRRAAIELYGGTGYRGEKLRLSRDEDSLSDIGGVSSIVVNEGTWQLCSRAGFEGRCEVYYPGSYPDIGRMNNRVESVRRVG